ncbi:zinc finger protein 2 [Drosophila ficusphila]|uniref:zinc finger protein 2 n=1 Tax=Drosophila ficusphila TaxID=30025 RepID=UPI001C8A4364|nr:zinc finger protein 2 [Drosophila ficusphila]
MPEYMLCRICLTEDINSEAMAPLFDDDDAQCRELVRKIEEVGSIKLVPLQNIPSMLCYSCVERLTSAHKFRELCQESERTFATNVVKAEMKSEPTDEGPHIVADHIEYIYESATDFIDGVEEDIEMDNMMEERLDDCVAETTQPYEIKDVVDEMDDNDFMVPNSTDSDYQPSERKPKVRKSRLTKRGRGRPRGSGSSHRRSLSQERPSVQSICKEESSTNIMCEICGNIYSKRAALNIHMRRHMAEKPFECEICGKTFAGPSELNRHIRVHTGEKPFTCKFCNRSFADRSSNIRHERTHTNERPFTCSTCGKAFSYSNVLKNHMLTHTGEKPFLCRPCNKTFSRKHQLEQHIGTMTHQQTVRNHQNNEPMRHSEIYQIEHKLNFLNKTMTLECRTCGGIIYNTKAKNLFLIENAQLLLNVNLISGVMLSNDPDLPSCICACCVLDLNNAIVFRERCIKTQQHLLRRIETQEAEDQGHIDYEEEEEENLTIKQESVISKLNSPGLPTIRLDDLEFVNEFQDLDDEDVEVGEEVAYDVDSLITSVQKEFESIYGDESDENEDRESLKEDKYNIMENCESGSPPDSPRETSKPKRKKQYVTWKNMTEDQIVERKRQQRKRDCVCEQCGRHFTDQSNFKLHMLRHTGIKNFACQECGKRFYTEHLMTLHQRIVHQGEKPYSCRYCSKSFHNSTTRVVHERAHTNAKPYACRHCDKSFSSASGRKRHELIHTGVRAFACTICEQSFQRNTHLKAHLRSKFHIFKARENGIELG